VNVDHTSSRFSKGFRRQRTGGPLRQDLYTEVNVFVCGVAAIVAVDLSKENDGWSAPEALGSAVIFNRQGDR